MFTVLPKGATDVNIRRLRAWYQELGFTADGWHGPAVVVTFATASPPCHVYRFYSRHAAAADWAPISEGAFGFTDSWRKVYPDGAPATLTLVVLSRGPPETVYRSLVASRPCWASSG